MAIKKKVYDLFDYGCDLEKRVIDLGSRKVYSNSESGVDAELANDVVKSIFLMELESHDPITFLLSNPGGDEFHSAGIYDAIKLAKSPTTIVVHGMAMSAGSIILQAAKRRLIAPSATLMLHYGSWGYNDHPQTMYNWADQGKKIDAWMEDTYLLRIREKHPDFTREKLKEMILHDKFFSAEEAVAIGLADGILT